jgi:hypothetical protein
MKFPRLILPLLSVVLLTGCTHSTYTPYVGAQQDWRTAPGGFAETIEGMPVYHGLPPVPYDIVGAVELDGYELSHPLRKAVEEARAHGGNAVIVRIALWDYATRLQNPTLCLPSMR